MSNQVNESGQYQNITSTTTLFLGAGQLLGIFVSSASSTPTIKVSDGATTVVNTFTPTGATYYPIPAQITGSCVVTISGTVDCCAFWTR